MNLQLGCVVEGYDPRLYPVEGSDAVPVTVWISNDGGNLRKPGAIGHYEGIMPNASDDNDDRTFRFAKEYLECRVRAYKQLREEKGRLNRELTLAKDKAKDNDLLLKALYP